VILGGDEKKGSNRRRNGIHENALGPCTTAAVRDQRFIAFQKVQLLLVLLRACGERHAALPDHVLQACRHAIEKVFFLLTEDDGVVSKDVFDASPNTLEADRGVGVGGERRSRRREEKIIERRRDWKMERRMRRRSEVRGQ